MEISNFCKKENIKALDINDWIDNKRGNFLLTKNYTRYLRKQKIDILKIKKNKNLN